MASWADQHLCVLCIEWGPLVRLKCKPPLGFRCDPTTASVITCCDCQISAPETGASQTSTESQHNGEGLLSGSFEQAATASTHLMELKVNSAAPSRREPQSPTHGETTVRWYSQLATPWELAVSHANGDQCTGSWICSTPKLLITDMTLMWRGHSSQVTSIHLLSPCFVSIWLNPLTMPFSPLTCVISSWQWHDLINSTGMFF